MNRDIKVDVIGGIGDDQWGKQFPSGRRIYNPFTVSGCVTAEGGGLGGNSGLFLIFNYMGGKYMKKECVKLNTGVNKLKVFEAFSGYGSQRMALRNIGVNFESVGISEIDIPAILSYASIHDGLDSGDNDFEYPTKEEMIKFLEDKNIGLDFKSGKIKLPKNLEKLKQIYKATVLSKCFGDVCLLNPNELPDMDIFTYSFPCTDLSVAGQMQGMERGKTRSGLLYECEKIIEAKKPKCLLLENVKNLVGKKFKDQFDEWLDYLESLGYTNYYSVLNAKDYGVPQNRERVFVVSILGEHDEYTFPQKQLLDLRLKDVLEPQVEEKYYLSDEVQARFKPNDKFKDMSANIVGTTAPDFRTIGQRDLCYQENSIMGALVATDYKQPKQIVELTQVGSLEGKHEQSSRVYSENGVSPTIMAGERKTCTGGYVSPKVMVERIGGCFDTETSTHQAGSVYEKDGLSPTLTTMEGGYRQPCITVEGKLECEGWHDIETRVHSTEGLGVCVETRNRAKYIEYEIDYVIGSTQKHAFIGDGSFSPTLTSAMGTGGGHVPMIGGKHYRIRKLTPLECWRLMGCSDDDFYKAKQFNSDSQLYKQAGNSIVVNVLEGIFANMFNKSSDNGECL